jgi:hypothetical protein
VSEKNEGTVEERARSVWPIEWWNRSLEGGHERLEGTSAFYRIYIDPMLAGMKVGVFCNRKIVKQFTAPTLEQAVNAAREAALKHFTDLSKGESI